MQEHLDTFSYGSSEAPAQNPQNLPHHTAAPLRVTSGKGKRERGASVVLPEALTRIGRRVRSEPCSDEVREEVVEVEEVGPQRSFAKRLYVRVLQDVTEAQRSAAIAVMVTVSLILPLSLAVLVAALDEGSWVLLAAGVSSAIPSVVLLFSLYRNAVVATWTMRLFSFGFVCSTLLLDIRGVQSGTVVWPLLILLLDFILLVRHCSKDTTSKLVVLTVCVYIIAKQIDSTQHRWLASAFEAGGVPEVCDCESPPCTVSAFTASVRAIIPIFVTLLNFILTRGFATQVLREREKIRKSVCTAQIAASHLAVFDLAAAEVLLDSASDMPAGLAHALHDILKNLATYRPYLPRSCFVAEFVTPPVRSHTTTLPAPVHAPSPFASSAQDISESLTEERSLQFFSSSTIVSPVRTVPDVERRTGLTLDDAENNMLPPPAATVLSTPTAGVGFAELQTRQASLAVANIRNTLERLGHDPTACFDFTATMLDTALSAVHSRGGVLDLFLGDRINASFNTSRPKVRHAVLAVAAIKEYIHSMRAHNWDVDAGIATGTVTCGDLGSNEVRRFTVLGTLPMTVWAMERAARALGVSALCNAACYTDTREEYAKELRLVPRVVAVVKATQDGDVEVVPSLPVYELLVRSVRTTAAAASALEWMYELDAIDIWRDYNKAVELHLLGQDLHEAVAAVLENAPAMVAEALKLAIGGDEPPQVLRVAV